MAPRSRDSDPSFAHTVANLEPSTDPAGAPTVSGQAWATLASPPCDPTNAAGQASLEERGFAARYAQGAVLGQGGMGEVRACTDQRIGREVALKVILAKPSSKVEVQRRFLREARVQGQLEHPSIVPV